MKVYISADIEGVTGVTSWDETDKKNGDYAPFAEQMTREVTACCQGALEANATEIFIKDSHSTGRNIIPKMLPREATLIRGWTRNPDMMVGGLDNSFDALMFVGYHSGCGLSGNPLSHTMNTLPYYIKVNDRMIGEFEMHSIIASGYGVKPIFLSGDKMQCERAEDFVPGIKTVAVKEGLGMATINHHPDESVEMIKKTARKAVERFSQIQFKQKGPFQIEIAFTNHFLAYKMSHFPGAELLSDTTIQYRAETQRDLAVFFMFVL